MLYIWYQNNLKWKGFTRKVIDLVEYYNFDIDLVSIRYC